MNITLFQTQPRSWQLMTWVVLCYAFVASVVPILAAEDLRPERWEREIQEFEAADLKSQPPKGAILLVGSSSIRLWTNAAAMFPRHRILTRGFGGSHMADLNHYTDRMVLAYSPSHVLVYEGDNDIAAGKSPKQVADEFATFVAGAACALARRDRKSTRLNSSHSRRSRMPSSA